MPFYGGGRGGYASGGRPPRIAKQPRRRPQGPYRGARPGITPARPRRRPSVTAPRTSPRLSRLLSHAQYLIANRPPEPLLRGDSTDLLGRPSASPLAERYASHLENVARKIKAETDRIERKATQAGLKGKAQRPVDLLGRPQASTLLGPGVLPGITDRKVQKEKRRQQRSVKQQRAIRAGRGTVDALLNAAGQARSPDPTTVNALITASAGLPVAGPEAALGRVAGIVAPKLAARGAGLAARGVGRGIARGALRVAEHTPAPLRTAAGETARVARRGWASAPARAVRTTARVGSAPVRIPTRYLGRHPGQSFLGSTGAVGAVAAASSGKPQDLLLAPARVASTTARTTFQHPGDVALTTLRTVPAMATAIAQLPADVVAAGTGHPAALGGLAKSQLEYLKQIQAVAENKSYTTEYTDARGVKHKETLTPEQLIQHNLGLVPVLTEGLVARRALRGKGAAAQEALGRTRLTREGRVARLQRQLESPEHAVRTKAEEKLGKMEAPRLTQRRQAHREARRAAATEERARARWHRELKKGKLERDFEDLSGRHLTTITRPDGKKLELSVGDVAMTLGRSGAHGFETPAQVRNWAEGLRRNLEDVPPERAISPNVISTRDTLDALARHPEAAFDPQLQTFLQKWNDLQYARSVERHTKRTGVKQTTPDPEDVRAQWMHLAREHGQPLPEEIVPPELRGISRHQPQRGVDAETAIRAEAVAAERRAQGMRRKAAGHERDRRGAIRELRVRRVADIRRTEVRAKTKGLRTLEKRRDKWAEKATEAEKKGNADLAKRMQTKVADLDRQIRERKARLAISASPARMRVVKRISESRTKAEELRRQADAEQARAAQLRSVVNRKRRAARMEAEALRAENAGELDLAHQLRQDAQALRREHNASQAQIREEFKAAAEGAGIREGRGTPIYFKETDAADRGHLNVLSQYSAGRLPKSEKRRIGTLAAQGRIDEGIATLFDNAYRDRVAMEMQTHVQQFMAENLDFERAPDGRVIHTGPKQREFERSGIVPPGYSAFAVQEFNRAFQRGAWDEASGLVDKSLAENKIRMDIRETKGEAGRKFAIVPTKSLEEFRDQMTAWSKGQRAFRTLGRLQSLGLLALSPAWFAFQLIASPLAALVAHPNPLAWARGMQKSLELWKNTPDAERIAFQSHYGGTTAEALTAQNVRIGLEPGTVKQMADASRLAAQSPVGRMGRAIWDNLRNGGPLIRGNRAYEAKIRDLVAMMEMEKLSKNAQKKIMQFDGKVMGLHDLVTRQIAELDGKPLAEQLNYYNTHPHAEAELTQAVTDTLGDWNGLTKGERWPAAVTVFYPFLRFSLRWLFHSMPKNHPLTTAVLLNISQRNAQEIQQLLGGAPSFFPDWGNVVVHTGPGGAPGMLMDLKRSAPGSNAVLEAMGQGGFNLHTLTAPFQPIIGTALTAAAHQDPLTGRESNRTQLELLARGIVGLPPPLRPIAGGIGERSDYSKLFAKILGRQGNIGEYLAPNPLIDPKREAEARRLSHLLNVAFGTTGPESQQAREQIDALFRKHGIQHSATGAASGGSSSSSSGGWAGGSSGGSSSSGKGW